MNLIRGLLGVAAATLLLAACASLPETPAAPNPTGQPATPASTGLPPTQPPASATPSANPAVEAAISALASQINVPPSQISVVSVEPQDWPDGCLGLPGPGEMCAMHVVPGYRVVLKAGETTYPYRTDLVGNEVRPDNPAPSGTQVSPQGTAVGTTQGSVQLPPAVLDRIATLLKQPPANVKVVQAETVMWRDACLGVSTPGMMCAQVITPGYRVIVSAGGNQYEFHTNQSGSAVRQAPSASGPQGAFIEWTSSGSPCRQVRFSLDTITQLPCTGAGGTSTSSPYTPGPRAAEFAALAAQFQSFTADTPAGRVTLNGSGTQAASPAEQRSVAEWASQVVRELLAPTGSTPLAPVVVWHREGGIAGFCDDLIIDLSGFAYPSSCKGSKPADLGRLRLTGPQLEQLYAWAGRLQPFSLEQKDPATADAMTIRLTFTGQGSSTAASADQQAIQQFASQVFAEAGK